MTPSRCTAVAVLVAAVLASPAAEASETCSDEQRAWAAACGGSFDGEVSAARCPDGRLIVEVHAAMTLEVEISRGDRGLRTVDGYALVPVGEFADWSAEPQQRRAAFDAIAQCADRVPVPLSTHDGGAAPSPAQAPARSATMPWLLVLALIGLGALAGTARLRPRRAAELLALAAAVWCVHAVMVPFAFFHQNGQGAMWIEYALRGHGGLDAYGPGYRELFSQVAAAFPSNPDMAVFVTQSALGALIPPALWIIARRAGAPSLVCWSIAFAVAVDPTLARLARSESYVGAIAALDALAVASAMEGASRGSLRTWRPWVGFATAGLLIAEAARIHPSGWLPAAMLPVALLVMPRGDAAPRDRALIALACAGVVAAIVASFSAGEMIDVLRSDVVPDRLGSRMTSPSLSLFGIAAAAIGLAAWRLERSVDGLVAVVAGVVVVAVMIVTNPLPYDFDAFQHAIYRLYVPVLVACAAGVAARIELRARASRRVVVVIAVTVAVAGAGHAFARWSALTSRASDVRESQWVRTWRGDLAPGARVVYLSRAGDRTYALPIYATEGGPVPIAIDTDRAATIEIPTGGYYYRSTLCTTPEGERACRALEGRHRLVEVERTTIEASASQPWAPVDREADVGLWRVADPRDQP